MTVVQYESEQTSGNGTDLTNDASIKGPHFDKTSFAFINCGDGGDSQQFQFTGDALKQLGHGNVLLTMAETLFEGSSQKSSLPPIDLNVDTDQFNASDVRRVMLLITEPSKLQLYNFNEDISNQVRLVNALDFFGIKLPKSPAGSCTSLVQKIKKYYEKQIDLMAQVHETVLELVALALTFDYADFKEVAKKILQYDVKVSVWYQHNGEVKINLLCPVSYIATEYIRSLPYLDLDQSSLDKTISRLSDSLNAQYTGEKEVNITVGQVHNAIKVQIDLASSYFSKLEDHFAQCLLKD
ncbi:hypothetical protein MP228_012349 [Amoeboaphelidium protococcarum]|nr:hypothetical protein MP228_012349 [Amoeboaphelidium protococcarum]